MGDYGLEGVIRVAMFQFLDSLVDANPSGELRHTDLNGFMFRGKNVKLVLQTWIRE